MIVSDFFEKVRILTRANQLDFPNNEIAQLADMEADYLYELSVQSEHLEQTKDQTPTVLTGTLTSNFVPTDHNIWIERVEYAADGINFKQLKRTNKTEYETNMGCRCEIGSLTNDLISEECTNYYIQTSQGVHIFPAGTTNGVYNIYIKDTPVIDWDDDNYEILLPNVPVNILVIGTALMYRDIENTNEYDKLFTKYDRYLQTHKKRLNKGSRVVQMKVKSHYDLM